MPLCCVLAVQEDVGGMWQGLVARIAPAFQPITAAVAEELWKPFKLQIAWMLLLLAAKNPNNRAIISKVQRTTLTPLAMQLENAERFYQQAAGMEAAAAAGKTIARSSSTGADGMSTSSSRRGSGAGHAGIGVDPQSSSAVSAPAGNMAAAGPVAAAAAVSHGSAASAVGSDVPVQPGSVDDDELSMLQAEVAFLGLMSNSSNAQGDATATELAQQ